jgi:hypothetical protein
VESYFWSNPWLGGVHLYMRYRCLFDLSLHRSSTVADLSALGWEAERAMWVWRRQMWAWEEEMLGKWRDVFLTLFCILMSPTNGCGGIYDPMVVACTCSSSPLIKQPTYHFYVGREEDITYSSKILIIYVSLF